MTTPDDLVTRLTNAATRDDALAIANSVKSLAVLRATADLLYIDSAEYLGAGALRYAIVNEARA